MFQAYVRTVTERTARLRRWAAARLEQAKTGRRYPVVDALQARRGVQFTVAIITIAELGALTRFDRPPQLMQPLGLTPRASTSAGRRRLGGLTQAGHGQARRALVEAAKASRHRAKVAAPIQARQHPSRRPSAPAPGVRRGACVDATARGGREASTRPRLPPPACASSSASWGRSPKHTP